MSSFIRPEHLTKVKVIHENDLQAGFGAVYLPYALDKKYTSAATSWGWQYVFPARQRSIDPRGDCMRRHHIDQSVVNKAIKLAIKQLGIAKKVSAHTFRHSFATHLQHICCKEGLIFVRFKHCLDTITWKRR